MVAISTKNKVIKSNGKAIVAILFTVLIAVTSIYYKYNKIVIDEGILSNNGYDFKIIKCGEFDECAYSRPISANRYMYLYDNTLKLHSDNARNEGTYFIPRVDGVPTTRSMCETKGFSDFGSGCSMVSLNYLVNNKYVVTVFAQYNAIISARPSVYNLKTYNEVYYYKNSRDNFVFELARIHNVTKPSDNNMRKKIAQKMIDEWGDK